MKTNRTIFLLLTVIFLLVAAKMAYTFITSKPTETNSYKNWWQQASPNDVSQIVIAKEGTALTIIKTGDANWRVNEYPALATEIQEWLPLLLTPTDPEVVAETTATHPKLGISDQAAALTLTVNGQEKRLLIGNKAIGGRYVKLEGSDNVYLVKGLPETLNSVETTDWMDKTVVRIAGDSINNLIWQRQKQEHKVLKDGENYKNEAGEILDTTLLNPLVMSLESLVVQGMIIPAETDTWIESPQLTLIINRHGQDPVVLTFYETDSNKVMTTSLQPGYYTLSEATYKNFDLQPADLVVK